MKPKGYSRLFVNSTAITAIIVATFAAPSASAASATWNGTTSATWSDVSNWGGPPATVPGAGEIATFNGAGNSNTTLDLGAGVTIGSLVFDTASAAGYTIGSGAVGSQTLTLGTTGSAITVNATVAANQLTNANLALTVTRTAGNGSTYYAVTNNSATNSLTLAGGISASTAGVKVLNVAGSGNSAISGAITSGTGNMSLFKTGSGTLTLSGGATFSGTGVTDGAGFASSAVFREGTTILNGGAYNNSGGELVIGGVATHGGAGTSATLQLDNAGSLTSMNWLSIGRGNGNGTATSNLTLNGSSSATADNFSAGYNAGNAGNIPKGTITLNGTSLLSIANNVNFAESPGSNITLNINNTATFRQTANANQTKVGMSDGAVGLINVNGGTASFERDFILGAGGTGSGKLVIDSGTVNVASGSERWLKLNDSASASTGQIDINGGNLNLNTNTDLRFSINANASGTNVVNLNGGAITGYTGNNNGVFSGSSVVDLNQGSNQAGVNNTFNLNGGTLTIGQVITNNNSGTAAFNFNGGTLRAAAASTTFVDLGGATQTANVLTGGAIIDSNGFNLTIPQALLSSGSGGLTKQGAGTLTLSATNTYTGPTLVTGGTLTLGSSGNIDTSSSVTINGSGAKFVQNNFGILPSPVTLTQGTIDANGTITTLTVANAVGNTLNPGAGTASILTVDTLAFQGAATINLQATGDLMDQSILSTNLSTNAAGQIVINATNTSGLWTSNEAGYDYTLIDYSSGSFTGDISHFVLGTISSLNSSQEATLVDTGSAIVLRITGVPLTWAGGTGNWDLTSNNWNGESGLTNYVDGSPVLFDDTTSLFDVVINSGAVSPGGIVFNNFGDYTISGSTINDVIAGTGTLIKNASGTVTINTNNTYTGATTINGGILEVNGAGSIATSSSISIAQFGQFKLNLTGSHTYSNPITGAGSVTKQGVGTLTLSGASTFTGDFTLDAGQLNLNSAGALGAGPGIITLNSATLDNTSGGLILMTPNKPVTLSSDISFIGSNSLFLSNGEVTLTGSRTVDVQANIFGMGAVVDSASGYNLVKTGAGKLVLNGGNIAGNLDIQSGIVAINQDFLGAAPIGTGTLQNDGAVGTKYSIWYGPADVASNVLIRNNDGSNTRKLGVIKRGSGTLTLTNNANTATGNLSVDSGRLVLNNTGTYGAENEDGSTNTGLATIVGNIAGTNAVLEINGATVNYNNRNNGDAQPYRSTLNVGNNGTSAGTLKMSAGSLTLNRQLALSVTNGAYGALTQTGGTTSVGGFLATAVGGADARGVLNLSGGTFTQAGPVTNGASGIGLINLSGTAIFNQTSTGDNGLWLGENGTGILNVGGAASLTIAATNNGLQVGRNASGVGTINLNGGSATVQKVYKGAGTGTLNFNGGTLAANTTSTTFLTGLTNAFVNAAGGTINNGGNAITIGQALLAPSGNGVSATGLTFSGGGYIDTPIVTITGDGTGATAVANIDASGNLTGITITNPGIGYTTASFTLSGGGIGNTGSIGGTPTFVANTSGGMTFTGSNITTLTGVNTYTGNTTVNAGSTLQVFDNAALKFTPSANGVSNKITGSGSANLDGDFNIDQTGAAIANGNSWTLVDVGTLTETFGTNFTVVGFTETSGVWTKVDGDNTWTFDEATGALTLAVSAGGYDSWNGANAGGQTADLDFDLDGVKNGVEFFMNVSTPGFTANPALVGSGANSTVTWPNGGNIPASAYGTQFVVEISTDLVNWTAVPVESLTTNTDGPGGALTYTLTGTGKSFVRLKVTPN
jgi:autotransporter-associated beta strand protein